MRFAFGDDVVTKNLGGRAPIDILIDDIHAIGKDLVFMLHLVSRILPSTGI